MKVGLTLVGIQVRKYALIVKKAEECGFESAWMPEHVILPTEIPPLWPGEGSAAPIHPRTELYDPWVTLAYLAAATDNINLASQSYLLALRHPITVARCVTTLDMLCHGRLLLGCTDGWLGQVKAIAEAGATVQKLRAFRGEYGREAEPFDITVSSHRLGPPGVDDLRRLEEAGVSRIVTQPWPKPAGRLTMDHILNGLERYAEAVVSKLS